MKRCLNPRTSWQIYFRYLLSGGKVPHVQRTVVRGDGPAPMGMNCRVLRPAIMRPKTVKIEERPGNQGAINLVEGGPVRTSDQERLTIRRGYNSIAYRLEIQMGRFISNFAM